MQPPKDKQAKAFLDGIKKLGAQPKIADSASQVADKKVTLIQRAESRLKGYTSEQKIISGINFLFAGLLAMTSFSQLSKGFSKDENGERHIQPTQMGIGIVSALLAAGSAYLGVKPLMMGAAR